MARPRSSDDIERARIRLESTRDRLSFETTKLYCRTGISIISILAGVTIVAIIAWAFVKVTDKPPWLQAVLSILPSAPLSWIIWSQNKELKRFRTHEAWLRAHSHRSEPHVEPTGDSYAP